MYKNYIKRLLDILMSFVLLLVFLPISIAIAVAIKFTSEGPVMADVPERIGENNKKFKMYKFRSMIVNAHYMLRENPEYKQLFEEYKRGSYKLKKDPRITKVGKFIRKHSLDEIPQLINVLKGDMSIVGPRAYYNDELENQQRKYPHVKTLVKKVITVKPGITGLWQVSGRSNINFDERIVLDSQYVDTLSFMQDLKIIVKTPWVMVSGKGAV
jgi:lipopolysaccharide/colanic/teichoic acid biosynthesis glycosyltransferase